MGGDPVLEKLSDIVKAFNQQFGDIQWKDADKIRKVITEDIPARVAQDRAYRNAQAHSDRAGARLEHDRALKGVVLDLLADHTELYKQFSDNPGFRQWLTEAVFDVTYMRTAGPAGEGTRPAA